MNIFIPSSKRAHKQTTFDNLPKNLQARTKLVIPAGEEAAYSAYPYVSIPVKGIGPTRQWCIDQGGKVVMLDDDLTFATRRTDDPTKFVSASDGDIDALFSDIFIGLDDFAHVGVGTREGGNRRTESSIEVGRMLRILAYDTRVLKKHDIRFDEIPVMEDFHVTLSLLRQGLPNLIINWIVHNQNGSNLAGGCSQYRTMEVQGKAADELARRHPRFVTVVEKQTKTAWNGQPRKDVVIQWKKAYESHQ